MHIDITTSENLVLVPSVPKTKKRKRKQKQKLLPISGNELLNITQETSKCAQITIPKKGYDTQIAENNATGFVKWLKYAADWQQISFPVFEDMLRLFNEAQQKLIEAEDLTALTQLYAKLSNWTALGVDKALTKIKVVLVETIRYVNYGRRTVLEFLFSAKTVEDTMWWERLITYITIWEEIWYN